jgi:hypothetical protein
MHLTCTWEQAILNLPELCNGSQILIQSYQFSVLERDFISPGNTVPVASTEAAPYAVQGNGTKRITDRQELSYGPWMTKAGCFNKLLVLEHQNKWTTLPG